MKMFHTVKYSFVSLWDECACGIKLVWFIAPAGKIYPYLCIRWYEFVNFLIKMNSTYTCTHGLTFKRCQGYFRLKNKTQHFPNSCVHLQCLTLLGLGLAHWHRFVLRVGANQSTFSSISHSYPPTLIYYSIHLFFREKNSTQSQWAHQSITFVIVVIFVAHICTSTEYMHTEKIYTN